MVFANLYLKLLGHRDRLTSLLSERITVRTYVTRTKLLPSLRCQIPGARKVFCPLGSRALVINRFQGQHIPMDFPAVRAWLVQAKTAILIEHDSVAVHNILAWDFSRHYRNHVSTIRLKRDPVGIKLLLRFILTDRESARRIWSDNGRGS